MPAVCILLIAINVLVFLVDQATTVSVLVPTPDGGYAQTMMGGLSARYSMIPAYVTGQLASMPILPLSLHPAWLTIFTSMFLHANWLHIGGNMLYLWIFGNNIEDVLGPGRFTLFYFACGVGAAATQISSDPSSVVPTIGASGAIAGLMGGYILLYPSASVLSLIPLFGIVPLFINVPALLVIGYWILLQMVNEEFLRSGGMLTSGGGVAYLAHIGGFAMGMILIMVFGGRSLLPRRGTWEG